MRGRALVLYALCCVLWGSTWLVIKIGLEDLPPFLFAAARMAIASLVVAPLAFRSGWPALPKGEWAWLSLVGSLQLGVSYAAVFFAERFISSGLTATLFCSYPILVIAFAHLLIVGERATALHVSSAALGICGIVLLEGPLIGPVRIDSEAALGLLLPLGAAATSALGNVLQKKHLGSVPLGVNLWAQTLIGAIALFALHGLFEEGQAAHFTPRAMAALLYLAVPGTVITFLALFWLLPRIPLALIGAIPLIDTLVALVLGALVLHETIGWRLAVGGGFVLSGAALASRTKLPRAVGNST